MRGVAKTRVNRIVEVRDGFVYPGYKSQRDRTARGRSPVRRSQPLRCPRGYERGAIDLRVSLVVVVALALVAILLAAGCGPQRPPGPPPGEVILAAGDIASCDTEADEATAELLGATEGTVLALGDEAYPRGTAREFEECYDPSWGRFKGRTRPVPGNHEYYTEGARGYFGYFGEAAGDPEEGYYSYDLGSWHVVALNSNCEEVRCGPGSPQRRWLEEDLAANGQARCTLAYMHHPRFSSGEKHGSTDGGVQRLWEALYEANTDVVLSAHEHNYERFSAQDPQGRADPERGIRQFVVGTGGGGGEGPISDPIANSEVRTDGTDGVLEVKLQPGGYEWRFVAVEGAGFVDSGSAGCH
jgi:acid phosphatase type 7